MRILIAVMLILSVAALSGLETVPVPASAPLTPDQLSAAFGSGFYGGFVCGAAGVVAAAGLIAASGIVTAGSGVIWTIAISTSVASHVAGACLLLD